MYIADIKVKSKRVVRKLNKTITNKNIDIKNKKFKRRSVESIGKIHNRRKLYKINNNSSKYDVSNNTEDTSDTNYASQKVEDAIKHNTKNSFSLFNKKGYNATKNIIEEIYNERVKSNYNKGNTISELKQDTVESIKVNKEKILNNDNKQNNTDTFYKDSYEFKTNNYTKTNKNTKKESNNIIFNNETNIDTEEFKKINKSVIKTKEQVFKNTSIKTKENTKANSIKGSCRTDKIKDTSKIDFINNIKYSNTEMYYKNKSFKNKNIPKYKKQIEEVINSIKKHSNNIKKVIRTIIQSTKSLINILMAGGWLVIVIIIIISSVAFITSSIFGIFFSDSVSSNTVTIRYVMSELNTEFINQIIDIQKNNEYDDYESTGQRAEWKNVIAVYIAKSSNGNYQTELITLDETQINTFREVFWKMNQITYTTEEITKEHKIIDNDGNVRTEERSGIKLKITIQNKSINEMNLSEAQINMINEILKDNYAMLWEELLNTSSNGNISIVVMAQSQLGQVGGQPYWSWYGFDSRVEWCATFVSWCANQCGFIEAGLIPKFASCESEGVAWFKACNLWQDNSYIPNAGDIIFFDWEQDGHSDHVRYRRKN